MNINSVSLLSRQSLTVFHCWVSLLSRRINSWIKWITCEIHKTLRKLLIRIHESTRPKWSPGVGPSFHRFNSWIWWVFTLGPYESRFRFKWLSLNFNESWHEMTWNDMQWHEMTWNDMQWHEMTCNDMQWHAMTWISNLESQQWFIRDSTVIHVMSLHVIACHCMSLHVISCHCMSFHVIACHFMSLHVISCHVISSDLAWISVNLRFNSNLKWISNESLLRFESESTFLQWISNDSLLRFTSQQWFIADSLEIHLWFTWEFEMNHCWISSWFFNESEMNHWWNWDESRVDSLTIHC